MENQQVMAMCTIDLSVAFDTVDHQVLINVLQHKYGVIDTALKWFDEYLRPCQCIEKFGNSTSDKLDLQFSFWQGSCARANLFSIYSSTIKEVIPNDIYVNGYADDHALDNNFDTRSHEDEHETISRLENCISDIKVWMDKNHLKMNSSKTEFIMFGSKHFINKCDTESITVKGKNISRSDHVRYLGGWLDQTLSMRKHINSKSQTAMYNLHKIHQLRHTLTQEAANTLALGIFISHLDYANAILFGLLDVIINEYQWMQNIVSLIVLNCSKYDSATEALRDLHWFPIRACIQYKILVMVYKCLDKSAPYYLKGLLVQNPITRPKLSSEASNWILIVPRTFRKTFASRSFSVAGPQLWNSLPAFLRATEILEKFKNDLKNFLSKCYFD